MAEYTAAQLAEIINGTINGDAERKITGVNSLGLATEQDLSFLSTIKYRHKMDVSKAGIVLIGNNIQVEPSEKRTYITCEDADKAFGKLCGLFTPEPIKYEPGIAPGAFVHPTATVDPTASIGPNAVIQEGAVIGKNTVICGGAYIGHFAKVGDDCFISANVSIMHRCILGNKVIIHPGAAIGGDGFGFTPTLRGLIKVPQNGIVQIDNDVEIGANSTIDRARFGKTWIKKGVKIDNMVHVAHNVIVGNSSVLIGQCGIAGSAEIGCGVIVAAQAGVNGHITLGDGCRIAGASAVQKSVPPGVSVFGTPAETEREFFERHTLPRKVKRLVSRIEQLEAALAALTAEKKEGEE